MNFTKMLELLPGKIDHQFLNDLKRERDNWWQRGDGPKYQEVLDAIPEIKGDMQIQDGVVTVLGECDLDIAGIAKQLHYWRKGPFNLFGTHIETEWRSDYKWNRLKDALPDLEDKLVIDIGCNNGYFMYRMLEHGPKLVLGIDPCIQFNAQFEMVNKFVQADNLHFEMFGVEHIGYMPNSFDVMFSMGILYHHRTPLQQLFDMRQALRHQGTLVLETIVIPGEEEICITPRDRYNGMKNIWLLPTINMLKLWLEKSSFKNIEVISTEWDGVDEQRSTEWSANVSYQNFLDPNDHTKTIEGLPAPKRCIIKATVHK
jgi:tRNA (mo5U34)-methyltransferase